MSEVELSKLFSKYSEVGELPDWENLLATNHLLAIIAQELMLIRENLDFLTTKQGALKVLTEGKV